MTASALAIAEELASVLEEEARRRSERPLDFYVPLPHQEAFHRSPAKERWAVTTNGTGKTKMGAAEVCALVEGRSNWWIGPPSEIWCGAVSLADSAAVQRKAVRELIKPELIRAWPNETNPHAESVLSLTNDWVVRFKAYEQGRERWQGGNIALFWPDEEPPGDIYDEGFSRTRTGGRVIVTLTALNGLKWDAAYQRVYVRWLAFKAKHPGAKWGEVAPDLFVMTASMADNTHLPPGEVEKQRAMFADRPLMQRVRVDTGEWLDTSEDAIVPMDKLGSHIYTLDDPPRGEWAARAIWIDSAFSKSETSDRFALAHAGRSMDGRVYLLSQVFGRLSADERVSASVKAIREAGCPPCYVQRTTPDGEFAVRLNDALMRAGLPAVVQQYPSKGAVQGKVERAQSFAVIVGNGQAFVHESCQEFRREAGTFPHAEHDDVFDAGMGAMMILVEPHDDGAAWAANERAHQMASQARGSSDNPWASDPRYNDNAPDREMMLEDSMLDGD